MGQEKNAAKVGLDGVLEDLRRHAETRRPTVERGGRDLGHRRTRDHCLGITPHTDPNEAKAEKPDLPRAKDMGGNKKSNEKRKCWLGVQAEEAQLVKIRCSICGKRQTVYVHSEKDADTCCLCNYIIETEDRRKAT